VISPDKRKSFMPTLEYIGDQAAALDLPPAFIPVGATFDMMKGQE
jgi:hypothetical protein